jgi:modulator of FtsH protease
VAYDPALWHDLFEMTGGASAALAGLIFVAVSLNHEQILKFPALPPLAMQTLSVLIALLLACVVGLTPGQSRTALGSEILVLAAGLFALVIGTTIRTLSATPQRDWQVRRLGLGLVVTVPNVVAGISLLTGAGGGLYWLLVEFIAGLLVSAFYAWILLIEIRR